MGNQFVRMMMVGLCACAGFGPLGCTGLKTGARPEAFQRLDRDGDGRLKSDEFSDGLKRSAFEKIDRNSDGAIDLEEWLAASPNPAAAKADFSALDRDQNQRICFLEFSDAAAHAVDFDKLFRETERNKDGGVSPDEFEARPAFKIFSVQF